MAEFLRCISACAVATIVKVYSGRLVAEKRMIN